jgi:hypothetical protein
MKHEKTFDAINKLKEVELELHRLKNLLEITGRALDAKSEWVGLTDEEIREILVKFYAYNPRLVSFAQEIQAKLKEKNT